MSSNSSNHKISSNKTSHNTLSIVALIILLIVFLLPLSQTNWYTVLYSLSPRIADSLKTNLDSDLNWSFIKKNPLLSTEPAKAPLPLSYKNFINGSFQKRFEDYFMRGNVLWGWLVKICNQIAFTAFNQVNLTYGPPAFLGKEGYLMQSMYLNAFNRQKSLPEENYIKRVKKLKVLNDLLLEKHIPLLITISPNIIELYPELLPNHYKDPTRLTRKNGYEYMQKPLKESRIPVVDNFKILQSLKDDLTELDIEKNEFRFFERTGAHWNSIGSCIATNNIIAKISALTKKELKQIPCSPAHLENLKNDDDDLINVANLLFTEHYKKKALYIPEVQKLYETPPVRVLIIGTSFNFAILRLLNKSNIADTKFLFYYKSVYSKKKKGTPLKRNEIDWENDILKNDVIILEANYSGLGKVGLEFVQDAIRKLTLLKMTPAKLEQYKKRKANKKKKIKKALAKRINKNRINQDNEEFDPFPQ